MRHSP